MFTTTTTDTAPASPPMTTDEWPPAGGRSEEALVDSAAWSSVSGTGPRAAGSAESRPIPTFVSPFD